MSPVTALAPPRPAPRTADAGADRGRPRLRGVDVTRGLAVAGMLLVDDRGSDAIGVQLVHSPWHGLRVADVVFPVFLLVVGVTMPFSRRAERPRAALLRTARLALLGLAVVTVKHGPGSLATGVLGHIAGAYLLCWLLLRLPRRAQTPVAVGVLAGVSLLSLLVPVPGVGRPALEPGASWAAWADGLVGVHLSAESPHAYLTSAATVYLGVLAGRVLRTSPGRAAVRRLALGAVPVLAAGLLLATVLPVNKRLWTPSYVLVTGGIGLLLLAAVHWAVDVRGFRRPLRPLEVLGINAIVAFVTSEVVFRAVLGHGVQRAAVAALERAAGGPVAAWAWALLAVVTAWAVCAQLARRGVVVRV